jgi:hypothetical protein
MRREHAPDPFVGLVELALVQVVEAEAVHVEIDERGPDVDRVQVLGHEANPGALLDDELAFLARRPFSAVVEAVQLLAGDADDHRPGGVVVRRRAVPAERGVHVKGEAVIGVLGQAVEAGLEPPARRRRREIGRREEVLPRGEADQALLDLLQALPRDPLAFLDRADIGHRLLDLALSFKGAIHGSTLCDLINRRGTPWH